MKTIKSWLLTTLLLVSCASSKAEIASKYFNLENNIYALKNNAIVQKTGNFREIKFGVVSDIHNNKDKAEKIARKFYEMKVDAIIIAGDMAVTLSDSAKIPEDEEITNSLTPFLLTGKPVYVIAGNHETKKGYFDTLNSLEKKYDNLFDLAALKYIDLNGVNIFGISGGSPNPSGGFLVKEGIKSMDRSVFSLDKDPVLMVSHTPPKFDFPGAIDCVYDVKVNDTGKKISDRHKGEKIIYEGEAVTRINPKNEGAKELTDLIQGNNINFSVSGHYHMNQGANDLTKVIGENEFSERLFMNPGACQYNRAGILTIKDHQAKYDLLKVE